jgi:hypothetical protein
MKQILQNIQTSQTELVDVPAPLCRPGHLLIGSRFSLISVGTERMLVDFGKAGWIEKARQQPEKVRQGVCNPPLRQHQSAEDENGDRCLFSHRGDAPE